MLKPDVLRRKKDFSSIYNKGKSVGDRYIVVFFRKNETGFNRIAFLASKKVGKSVTRNRARRLMKESYRAIRARVGTGYDLIFIARNSIRDVKCMDVQRSMENALRRAKLLGPPANGRQPAGTEGDRP